MEPYKAKNDRVSDERSPGGTKLVPRKVDSAKLVDTLERLESWTNNYQNWSQMGMLEQCYRDTVRMCVTDSDLDLPEEMRHAFAALTAELFRPRSDDLVNDERWNSSHFKPLEDYYVRVLGRLFFQVWRKEKLPQHLDDPTLEKEIYKDLEAEGLVPSRADTEAKRDLAQWLPVDLNDE